jgi:hypothetical protein
MSTSLARRIRRIGLMRAASTETVVVKDEQGNDTEATLVKYRTQRRFMTEEEREAIKASLIADHRARRKRHD